MDIPANKQYPRKQQISTSFYGKFRLLPNAENNKSCLIFPRIVICLAIWEPADDVSFSSLSCLSAIKAEDDHKHRLEIVQEPVRSREGGHLINGRDLIVRQEQFVSII